MRKLKLQELERLSIQQFKSEKKIPLVVVLDNIRSGMNVGSFFRTCDAFKIDQLILCGITARPPHKEILKTAIGATNSVTWKYNASAVDEVVRLRKENYEIIGIEQTDESMALSSLNISNTKRYALVFGNEVHGVSDDILPHLDAAVEIEQFGTKHSLNVSVCAGIVLWNFSRNFLGS